jgi:hypothetical protein
MEGDVKLTLKPSEEVVAKALAEVTTTDSAGRVIKLKKPAVLEQFRLIEALGDTAENSTYMNMVLPLIYVTAIDDLPVFYPTSKMQVEALIQQLDEHGVRAVMNKVREHFGRKDPEQSKAELKK